jgi:hypothetical protein
MRSRPRCAPSLDALESRLAPAISSIPGDIFSTPRVGAVFTVLGSGGGVSG